MADTPELPELDVTEEDRRIVVSRTDDKEFGPWTQLTIRERQLRQAMAAIATLRGPLTGEAMEVAIAKCVGQLQRAQNDGRLSQIRKWQKWTELLQSLMIEMQGTLLVENRELRASTQRLIDLVRHQRSELFEAQLISAEEFAEMLSDSEGGERVSRLEGYDAMRYRAEAAESKVRELEAAAGAARAEGIREAAELPRPAKSWRTNDGLHPSPVS